MTRLSDYNAPFHARGAVTVNTMADFPEPSTGVITLEDNMVYYISDNVSTTDRFVLGSGTAIEGLSLFTPTFEYTGTGTMFTGVDVTTSWFNLNMSAPNGKIWDMSDTVGGVQIFAIGNCFINECVSIGDFDDLGTVDFINVGCASTEQGIVFTGTNFNIVSFLKFSVISTNLATFNGIDLGTSVHQTLEFTDLAFFNTNASAFGITGLASNGNVSAGNVATVNSCSFQGGMGSLENINANDSRWRFDGNNNIQDTKEDGLLSLNGNATETTADVTPGVAVLVAGTWVVERVSHFTGTTGGRLTYNGERDIVVPVDITATVEASSGTGKDVTMYLALNGTIIANSGKSNTVGANDPKNTSCPWQLLVSEGDYLELYIANDTDTTNLIVVDAVIRVR